MHDDAVVRMGSRQRDLAPAQVALHLVVRPVQRGTPEEPESDEAASDALCAELRSAATMAAPFFDRGPGYARLAGGASCAQVDWL